MSCPVCVQRAERLVHQQQRRPGDDGPGERGPVRHPAGQLVRVCVAEPGQAYGAQDGVGLVVQFRVVAFVPPGGALRLRPPKGPFFLVVSQGNSIGVWNSMPRSGDGPATAWPPTVTVPSSACRARATIRSSVDLPQPEGSRCMGPEVRHHCGEIRRNCATHECRRRHERQPRLYRWQAGRGNILRLSVFSPDAICGITPIQAMLEVKDFDTDRARRQPHARQNSDVALPQSHAQRAVDPRYGRKRFRAIAGAPMMTPIATPIAMSGFTDEAVKEFAPIFTQLGMTVSQGGAGGRLDSATPAKDWRTALQPGESIAAVLVSGDMTMTGGGTVTYNDGKHVLAFGHPMFNLGPVDMPLAKEDYHHHPRVLLSTHQNGQCF